MPKTVKKGAFGLLNIQFVAKYRKQTLKRTFGAGTVLGFSQRWADFQNVGRTGTRAPVEYSKVGKLGSFHYRL